VSPAGTVPVRPHRAATAIGNPFVHLDRATSTNDHARGLALAGAPAGTVVLAEEQTAGRGRQGRTWLAPRGTGLTLSVLFRFDRADVGRVPLLPLLSAVAVCEACEAVAPVQCKIKWPNDVQVGGRKTAGILIESRHHDGWAVIGIGLNVNATQADLGPELGELATSLRVEAQEACDRQEVLTSLLDRLGARLDSPFSPEELLTAYRERDVLSGRAVHWRAGGSELSGEARGIDERGNLVVFTTDGEQVALDAGEVHLEPEHNA
jgi:BirA family transcriptional regulator, biotin operon repressor / biotin---[acetyl-CoA-carboxylase] ligase